VFLIGLPGSGKTTLAREVADLIDIPYLDLDDEIEKSTGLAVGDIFKSGETQFRKVETETLNRIIQENLNFILATGGGAPCFNDNINLMNTAGKVIFLDVSVDEIVNRISRQSIDRPLLKGNLNERIRSLHSQRIDIYRQAQFLLAGNNLQPSQIVELIK
jgi:shikimate kinase